MIDDHKINMVLPEGESLTAEFKKHSIPSHLHRLTLVVSSSRSSTYFRVRLRLSSRREGRLAATSVRLLMQVGIVPRIVENIEEIFSSDAPRRNAHKNGALGSKGERHESRPLS